MLTFFGKTAKKPGLGSLNRDQMDRERIRLEHPTGRLRLRPSGPTLRALLIQCQDSIALCHRLGMQRGVTHMLGDLSQQARCLGVVVLSQCGLRLSHGQFDQGISFRQQCGVIRLLMRSGHDDGPGLDVPQRVRINP